MAEAKHAFVDDYPYLVYTNEDTLVYSNKADTSIDDISGGGDEEYNIKCYAFNSGTPTEIDSIIKLAEYRPLPDDDYVPIGDTITSAKAGTLLYCSVEQAVIMDSLENDAITFPKQKNGFIMPSSDVVVMDWS